MNIDRLHDRIMAGVTLRTILEEEGVIKRRFRTRFRMWFRRFFR